MISFHSRFNSYGDSDIFMLHSIQLNITEEMSFQALSRDLTSTTVHGQEIRVQKYQRDAALSLELTNFSTLGKEIIEKRLT